MSVQIGARPDSGFDNPIGMLKDCHRRIEHFLHVLCVVAERAAGREMTEEESTAVQAALSYFRTGGQRHTADEEQSLFPRMMERGAAESLAELNELEMEHTEAHTLHATAEGLYMRWIAEGRLGAEDREELRVATERLKALYAKHIEVEESVVFPRAAAMLDGGSLAAMGEEFRERRAR